MAENKRKAQSSLDNSSQRPRIMATTTDTSDGSTSATINVPTIQEIDAGASASASESESESAVSYTHLTLPTTAYV